MKVAKMDVRQNGCSSNFYVSNYVSVDLVIHIIRFGVSIDNLF
jgi:hypothetical protein